MKFHDASLYGFESYRADTMETRIYESSKGKN